jgi:DNA-binding transcriptional MerR regulator
MSTLGEITYSISEVEKMSGGEISQKQIRYWENKGYLPKAERNVCGDIAYRRFTKSQVEIIRAIKGFLDQGYTLARAAKLALNGKRLDQ